MNQSSKRRFGTSLLLAISSALMMLYAGCNSDSAAKSLRPAFIRADTSKIPAATLPSVKPSIILNRPQVPILCYHQIRNWVSSDSRRGEDYIVPLDNFRLQMKFLADNGYHTILPDQLYDYLLNGTQLPSKPIMLTFDDTRLEQYTIASEEMRKYGFKGVFFIMTVALDKPGYMSKQQVKQLADEGNIIGCHTWDHSNVKKYLANDWVKQLDRPSLELEKITGKPVKYFAYPFGLWDRKAIGEIKQRGFKAAFQLSEKRDSEDPLFTIRRMIVPGAWGTPTLQKWMNNNF
jgi:peptidoglycan/xylan/chitin deacetylase (PgdA/CDA1 family)